MALINSREQSSGIEKIQIQYPYFFKVVMSPSDQGLKIPGAFMKKFGCYLQNVVLLKVPTGASWQVELVRNENNGALLMKGWERFAEFYCIRKFHFLVFKYEGNSQFQVFIFDQTAMEIEYHVELETKHEELVEEEEEEEISANRASSKGNGKRQQEEEEDVEDEDSIEIINDDDEDDHYHYHHGRSEYRPRTRLSKKKLMVPEKQRKKVNIAAEKADHDTNSGKKKSLKCSTSIPNSNKSVPIMNKEKYKSYKRAQNFTSSNPFFVSFMQPSYVAKTVTLEIPVKFAKKYLSRKSERYYLKRRDSGGRKTMSWPVIVSPKPSMGARISVGWRKFVKENGLKVGNVCVFELMPGTRIFNITVY